MPTNRLNLSDAIKALPGGNVLPGPNDLVPVVQYSLWQPASSVPGFRRGVWGPWLALARPYTVSRTTGEMRAVTAGGEEYIKALSVYCTAGLPPEMLAPGSRTARIRVNSGGTASAPVFTNDDVYRVMEVRTWPQTSDHAEIHCTRDLGESQNGGV